MSLYQFQDFQDRVYPDVIIPGEGSLVAHPGDERDFEGKPPDDRWVPVKPAPAPKDNK